MTECLSSTEMHRVTATSKKTLTRALLYFYTQFYGCSNLGIVYFFTPEILQIGCSKACPLPEIIGSATRRQQDIIPLFRHIVPSLTKLCLNNGVIIATSSNHFLHIFLYIKILNDLVEYFFSIMSLTLRSVSLCSNPLSGCRIPP